MTTLSYIKRSLCSLLFILLFIPHQGYSQSIELPWSEDFSGVNEFELPAGWEANEENWYVFNSDFAGEEQPELVFWWEPVINGLARVQTPPINTTGYTELEVSFRHFVGNFGDPGIYDLRLVTIIGEDRNVVLEWIDPDNIPAEEVFVQLNREDHGVGAEELHLAWEFEGSSDNLTRWSIDDVHVREATVETSSETSWNMPERFELSQNYPNPFNPSTSIRYDLPQSAHVTVKVYDVSGRLMATIVDEQRQAGRHTARFDASDLASGLYLYRMRAGEFVQTRKLMLIK